MWYLVKSPYSVWRGYFRTIYGFDLSWQYLQVKPIHMWYQLKAENILNHMCMCIIDTLKTDWKLPISLKSLTVELKLRHILLKTSFTEPLCVQSLNLHSGRNFSCHSRSHIYANIKWHLARFHKDCTKQFHSGSDRTEIRLVMAYIEGMNVADLVYTVRRQCIKCIFELMSYLYSC